MHAQDKQTKSTGNSSCSCNVNNVKQTEGEVKCIFNANVWV